MHNKWLTLGVRLILGVKLMDDVKQRKQKSQEKQTPVAAKEMKYDGFLLRGKPK